MQMATKEAKYGKPYNIPIGLQEDNYYEMMYDLMDYVNRKGLTARQAQQLFIDCSDMVLDVKSIGEPISTNYLKIISDNLTKIAEKGIDTFTRCSSTND